MDRERVPMDRERVPLERERAAIDRERSPMERERAPMDRERPPMDRERPPMAMPFAVPSTGGHPSTMHPTEAQWLSPYVVTRKTEPKVDMVVEEQEGEAATRLL